MRIKMKKISAALLFFAFLPSCGLRQDSDSDSESARRRERNDPRNHKSGDCGYEVVSDYNSIVRSHNWKEKDECNLKIDQFLRKYPGVNCRATKDRGIEKDNFQVTEDAVNAMRI